MSVSQEIREEQKKALSSMSTKEKLAYFWDYYKLHVLAAVVIIAVIISFVRQYINNKDSAFYAVLINAGLNEANSELSTVMAEEFLEYAQIDPDQYEVSIDTTFSMSESVNAQYVMANQQKLFAMMQIGDISAVIADTENFEAYARHEYFYDMHSLLSQEDLEKYGAYFYYTDAVFFDDEKEASSLNENAQNDPAELTVNHRDPSAMERPVAVGIILTENNKIADAGYYTYLTEAAMTYQGHPSEAVLGIPVTFKEPELVIRFLEYIFE